jgi:hypothetical protein
LKYHHHLHDHDLSWRVRSGDKGGPKYMEGLRH